MAWLPVRSLRSHVQACLDQSHYREGQRNREYAEYGAIISFAKRGSPRRNLRRVSSVSCYILNHFLAVFARDQPSPARTGPSSAAQYAKEKPRNKSQRLLFIFILRVQRLYRKPSAAVCVNNASPRLRKTIVSRSGQARALAVFPCYEARGMIVL